MTMPTDAQHGSVPAGQVSGPVHVPDRPEPSMAEVLAAGGLKGWQARQLEQQAQHIALMSGIEQLVAHLGGILDASQAPPEADVLYQGTLLIRDVGYVHAGFKQSYNMVALANTSDDDVVVMNAGPQASGFPPNQGSGIVRVPAGAFRCFTLRGTEITVYGTVGDAFDLAIYVRPRPPASGSL